MPHIDFFFFFVLCLGRGQSVRRAYARVGSPAARAEQPKLPTCTYNTVLAPTKEYRVQIQEDNSVDSGASVRVPPTTEQTITVQLLVPSSPFSSACAGSVVPRVLVRYVRK